MMWKKPWGWAEGACIGAGLIVTGLVLQLSIGGINWQLMAWPVNIILAILYIAVLILFYALRRRIYFVQWTMTQKAAVSSLAFVAVMTLLMGLIRQENGIAAQQYNPLEIIGLTHMLSFWPFVLLYVWMTMVLGLETIHQICHFRWRSLPVILNHLGLFIALVSATLGNADMRRLTMNTRVGQPEWRATDTYGNLNELPLAIELHEFTMDEYPPKLMVISNATGKALPEGNPEHLLLEEGVSGGVVNGWTIEIEKHLDLAAQVYEAEDSTAVSKHDRVKYVEWGSLGATCAALVKAKSPDGTQERRGWVSCGSFMFPYQALRLDSATSLVMPDREPRRFASDVTIYTQRGEKMHTIIEVNKPAEVNGWKIYQLSYDETKGRWSDISVFELVTDPWLPVVYTGIIMMMLGAICMFIMGRKIYNKQPV